MHKINLYVGLKIPDTTAITTFHTLEKLGFKNLKKLTREIYCSFEFRGDESEFKKKISKVDILVNANKNKVRYELDDDAVHVLVKDIGDKCEGLCPTLQERLGLKEIISMEKGTLWSLEGVDKETAEKIAKKLLYNKHYQEIKIL